MLGNTTTATLCNSHNLGNTIMVAAGSNGNARKLNVDISRAFNVSRTFGAPSVRALCNPKCVPKRSSTSRGKDV